MQSRRLIIISMILLALVIPFTGCSSGDPAKDPVMPGISDATDYADSHSAAHHALLGFFSCRVDPENETIEVIPLRDVQFHLNALRFIEPPPPNRIVLSNINISSGQVDVDIQFVHPFPGLDQYTGFDVCGIVITSGSIYGFSDPDLVVAGEGDTRLVNADGLTRWWNPREFPYNETTPMWGYIDGVLGTPDYTAQFSATLNGYKYHADDLGIYDDLPTMDPSRRGAFIAGSGNTRHYTIEIDAGLEFNYAIDACWSPPIIEPVVVPDSFPESANREEPWCIVSRVISNTLYYNPSTGSGGGDLELQVDCYDWFHGDENIVRAESPGVFVPSSSYEPIGGTDVYWIYPVNLIDANITSFDPVTIWLSVEAGMDYEGLLPGKPTAAYAIPFQVNVVPQGDEIVLVWGDETAITHEDDGFDDFDPAVITNGEGNVLIGYFWWEPNEPDHIWNHMMFAQSADNGHTFGPGEWPQWMYDGTNIITDLCWNGKYTLGSNGQAFHSYWAPSGHSVQAHPKLPVLEHTCSSDGTVMENAGEMLYTAEGYPMMFGDLGGTILMRRGDYPNEAGTRTWPDFTGTEYVIAAQGTPNYLSKSRSTGMTSDGICHLVFWHTGMGYIRMISSTDISGESWGELVEVFLGLAEVWVGASDPGLWIDENDGFHVLFAGEYWWEDYQLIYGYSEDGQYWDEMESFEYLDVAPVEDGLNDTQVVVFGAFGDTYVWLCYETDGTVWCRYRKIGDEEFSEPIMVSEHGPAYLPDVYPNGDTGVMFTWEAPSLSGADDTDIFYRLAEFIRR